MASNGHRSHLLGEHQFYQEQYEYGIGHVYKDNGSFGDYWVILIANQIILEFIPSHKGEFDGLTHLLVQIIGCNQKSLSEFIRIFINQ